MPGQDAGVAERGDEGEGQRDAAEVGEHAGRGEHGLAQRTEPGGHHGLGEQQARAPSPMTARDGGQLDAAEQGGEVRALQRGGQVGRGVRSRARGRVLDGERAVQHGQRRGSRRRAPRRRAAGRRRASRRRAAPPLRRSGGRHVRRGSTVVGGHPETALPQPWPSTSLALLCWASVGKDGRPGDLGQLGGRGLVERAGLLHGGHQGRAGVSLEPEVLALGAVEVLLPQAGGGRVRGVLVDGLRVVLGELAVGRDRDLPVEALALELVGVAGVEVVPVDADRRLALLDGGGVDSTGRVVAGLLQLGEEVEAGLDVVEGAAVRQGGRVDAAEGRTGLGGVAVERDLALVLRLEQVREGGRAGLARAWRRSRWRCSRRSRCTSGPARPSGPRGCRRSRRPCTGASRPCWAALSAKELPRSRTSGARSWPLRDVTALISSWLAAVGVLDLDLDAVLLLEAVDEGAVVGPVAGQGDRVQRALLLGRLRPARPCRRRPRRRSRWRRSCRRWWWTRRRGPRRRH